jgi:hypothetical protein
MKVGLIQASGIGDIIIALPIAKYFVDRGHEVLWPIVEDFVPSFRPAAPYVEFIPIKRERGYLLQVPFQCLKDRACDRIVQPLYSYLKCRNEVTNQGLAQFLKFDEYKYAIAGVPFREKWNLAIVRDREREERLFHDVVRSGDFVLAHLRSSEGTAKIDLAPFAKGRQIIEITPRTNNVFDWLSVIERASLRILIDSCFANLTEQLEISGPKVFLRRSLMQFTPVLRGDWTFLTPASDRDRER